VKILHVLDHSLPIGSGYSYRSQSIVHHQRRLGLQPVVLTSPKQGTPHDGKEIIAEIPHYRTGPAGGTLPFARELLLIRRLAGRIAQVARSERVDIIHAHSPLLNGLPALWVARRMGLPVLYEVRSFWEDAAVSHGTFAEGSFRYRISQALETFVMRRVDRVVAICQGIKREIARRGIAEERIAVVPNGVSADWFEQRPRAHALADRFSLGQGPVFAYIGSFSHYEGLPFLVQAAPEFLQSFPEACLLLVGGGRDEEAVREAVAKAGPRVMLVGRVPQSDVRDIYTLIDILVLPRRRIRLTELVTPLKPLEAMALGKAVLASDVGGHTELIQDGDTGLLFRAESQDALVAQSVQLGKDVGLRDRIGQQARRYVAEGRTWDRVLAGYAPLYTQVR